MKQNKISDVSQSKIKKNKNLRDERHICLCPTINSALNCEKSACSWLTNSLCGFTFYMWILWSCLILAAVGALAYMAYNHVAVKSQNKSYFVTCKAIADCDTTVGLQCLSRYDKYRCYCNAGFYWNGTRCAFTRNYLETCSNDYDCDSSKLLVCSSNNTCNCQRPRYWISASQTCDFWYHGCFDDNNNNQVYIEATPTQMTTSAYFVDSCIQLCFGFGFRFAHLNVDNNLHRCICAPDIVPGTINLNCANICPSLTKEGGRLCGRLYSGNSNTRAVYLL